MIKDALQYLMQLRDAAKPILKVNGRDYEDTGSGLEPILEPVSDSMEFSTLTGLIEWAKIHGKDKKDTPYFIVKSPSRVTLYSQVFGPFQQRAHIASSFHNEVLFESGRFMDTESFIVGLLTKFDDNLDRAKILKLVGNVREEEVKNNADDGITQTVTARQGIVHKEDILVPNPVYLQPFKTFPEIECPTVPYIFRGRSGGPEWWALFEGDGVLWEAEAMQRISKWIKDHSDYEVYA